MADTFDLSTRTRVVFGDGVVDRVGALVSDVARDCGVANGAARVLVVTDPGLVATGHVDRAEAALRAVGHVVERFSDVRENPTTEDLDRCLAFIAGLESGRPDMILGFGGGSCIDVAKGTNFLLTNGGRMEDYWGDGKATEPLLPLIAVPTTAGTGTEVQRFALIANATTHQKMACGDPSAAARVAVLDPTLTLSQPPRVTACTGFDSIGHALESAVTKTRTDLSSRFSRESFVLGIKSLPRVLAVPGDIRARGDMLRAAALAGLAIEHSMLGAAHAMANPLTARFNVPHGQAVGMCLPHVVRFNAEDDAILAIYTELAREARLEGANSDAVEALVDVLRATLVRADMPTSLTDCGVTPDRFDALAEEASKQWTAQFNPRPVDAAKFRDLFERACSP